MYRKGDAKNTLAGEEADKCAKALGKYQLLLFTYWPHETWSMCTSSEQVCDRVITFCAKPVVVAELVEVLDFEGKVSNV